MNAAAQNYLELFGSPSDRAALSDAQIAKETQVSLPAAATPSITPNQRPDQLTQNDNRGRALELLGKGVKPIQVAATLGITPGAVAQYMSDAAFADEVKNLQMHSIFAQSVRDERLNKLEDVAVARVEETLNTYMGLMKPAEALGVLKVLNGLVRRAPVVTMPVDAGGDKVGTVGLQLPQFMLNSVVNIQVNHQNQVVEVDGRPMVTMGAQGVLMELEVEQERRQQELVKEVAQMMSPPERKPELLETQKTYPARVINALSLSATMVRTARQGTSKAAAFVAPQVGTERLGGQATTKLPTFKAGMIK